MDVLFYYREGCPPVLEEGCISGLEGRVVSP